MVRHRKAGPQISEGRDMTLEFTVPVDRKTWVHLAVCRGLNPLEWDYQTAEAATLCRRCPVRGACLEDAMLPRADGGVTDTGGLRGGLTEEQRRALRRQGKITAPPVYGTIPKVIPDPSDDDTEPELVTGMDARRDLYDQGMSDRAIARELGVASHQAITKWRTRTGLPANYDGAAARTITEAINTERKALHAQGFTDREIADQVDSDRNTIRQWRVRNSLPLNTGRVLVSA